MEGCTGSIAAYTAGCADNTQSEISGVVGPGHSYRTAMAVPGIGCRGDAEVMQAFRAIQLAIANIIQDSTAGVLLNRRCI